MSIKNVKVGKKYLRKDGKIVEVTAVGRSLLLYVHEGKDKEMMSDIIAFEKEHLDTKSEAKSVPFLELKNKSMTEEELIDFLNNNYYFDEMVDEAYWNDTNFASKAYNDLQNLIKEYNITITKEYPNVEEELHNLYQNAEKGLS